MLILFVLFLFDCIGLICGFVLWVTVFVAVRLFWCGCLVIRLVTCVVNLLLLMFC